MNDYLEIYFQNLIIHLHYFLNKFNLLHLILVIYLINYMNMNLFHFLKYYNKFLKFYFKFIYLYLLEHFNFNNKLLQSMFFKHKIILFKLLLLHD